MTSYLSAELKCQILSQHASCAVSTGHCLRYSFGLLLDSKKEGGLGYDFRTPKVYSGYSDSKQR